MLIHGGLWQEMDADGSWTRPGVVAGLRAHGHVVLAPNRLRRPPDWAAEVDYLLPLLPDRPLMVVAGSNGCSVAARLALADPERVERLLLAWPATAGDAESNRRAREHLASLGAPEATIEALLGGETLRGVRDEELAGLRLRVGVLPSMPSNVSHQRRTIDALLRLLPSAEELPACAETPHPAFAQYLPGMLATVHEFAASRVRRADAPAGSS